MAEGIVNYAMDLFSGNIDWNTAYQRPVYGFRIKKTFINIYKRANINQIFIFLLKKNVKCIYPQYLISRSRRMKEEEMFQRLEQYTQTDGQTGLP